MPQCVLCLNKWARSVFPPRSRLSKPRAESWTVWWSRRYTSTREPHRHLQKSDLQRLRSRRTIYTRRKGWRRRQPIPTKRRADFRDWDIDKWHTFHRRREVLQVLEPLRSKPTMVKRSRSHHSLLHRLQTQLLLCQWSMLFFRAPSTCRFTMSPSCKPIRWWLRR